MEEVSELTLIAGRFYRAKKPRRLSDGGYNDRHILWISTDGRRVQYDSPTIDNGRHYPAIDASLFLKWVGKEITKEQYMDTESIKEAAKNEPP